MAKDRKPAAAEMPQAAGMGGSIDQIREILFGSAQRELETRAVRIEKSLDQAAKEAAEQLGKTQRATERRLDKLTADFTARMEAHAARLAEAAKTAREDTAALESELGAQLRDSEQSLREELHDLGETMSRKLDQLQRELLEAIERLEDEKTGREALGNYLLEVGMRLKGDATLDALEASVGSGSAAQPDDDS